MGALVLTSVLFAAALHASWNAMLKTGGDPLVRLTIMEAGCGICGLAVLCVVGLPDRAALVFVIGSAFIHFLYFYLLLAAYRTGDYSLVYPIARGAAPALVGALAWAAADETIDALGIIGIVLVCGGIISLSRTRRAASEGRAVLLACCTGVTIASYTILDGMGGRVAGNVLSYIALLFVFNSIPLSAWTAISRRRELAGVIRANWRSGLIGGACAGTAYGVVIWAMSHAPMAFVSAARETGVVMAVLIGARVLREPAGAHRLAAAALVASGVCLLQFSHA